MLDRLTWRIGFIAAAALAALLFVGFATQTIRIEGFNLWPLKLEGFKAANARLTLDLDNVRIATSAADKAARLAKLQAEAEYRQRAEETDREHQADLADARARANRYAAANRVRYKADPGATSGTTPAANGGDAEGADRQGDNSGVVVTRADFDTLVDNSLRLKAAHEWACQQEGAECAK